jgi:hypothetical protein
MDVITHIEAGRLKWAGHLIQTNNQQPAKRIFIVKPEASRTRERPCSRWADNIDMYIQTTGERNWKTTAVNCENWGRLLRKAKAHTGLSCQR